MNDPTPSKRPVSITIIAIVGLLGALLTVPVILSPAAQSLGAWYPPYLAFASLVGAACMVGLWMMKKWAAYTYTGFVGVNQIVLLVMGVWNVLSLAIPVVVIFFALKNVSRMS